MLQEKYSAEIYLRNLTFLFATLAILIAMLGILGMSVFSITKRTKEIGIRKVNGAKISEVLVMLNRDFVKWVAIAFIIATPIAYYAMNKWLENFAYKTNLSWWIFALAGLLALGIALLTVSWQSWRAATRNPVEALRYE
jgi:putative ABC transport system permease protein